MSHITKARIMSSGIRDLDDDMGGRRMKVEQEKIYYKAVSVSPMDVHFSGFIGLRFFKDNIYNLSSLLVAYKVGVWAKPKVLGTKLAVFDEEEEARFFAGRECYHGKVFTCRCRNPIPLVNDIGCSNVDSDLTAEESVRRWTIWLGDDGWSHSSSQTAADEVMLIAEVFDTQKISGGSK